MKKLLKVISLTGTLTLLRMISNFVIAKLVATYGGPTGLALLGQFQSFVTSITGVVNSSSGAGLVRYTSENESKGYLRCSLWWKGCTYWTFIILSIVIPVLLVFSQPISVWLFEQSEFNYLIIAFALSLPFVVLSSYLNSVLNGLQQYRVFIILGFASVLVSLLLMIGLIFFFDMKGALMAIALQGGVIGIILFSLSIKKPWLKYKYWLGKTRISYKKEIGKYILMALTSALAGPLSLILVRNILIENTGWNLTGQWQAVWKISEVYLSVITVALSVYYLPRLSKLKSYGAIKSEIITVAKVLLPLVAFLSVGVFILRDLVISVLFTSEFNDARNYFAIQLIGNVIKIAGWLLAFVMLSKGASKWFISTEIIFSSSFVLLAYIFVSKYGAHGANFAYLLNYLAYLFFLLVNFKRFAK